MNVEMNTNTSVYLQGVSAAGVEAPSGENCAACGAEKVPDPERKTGKTGGLPDLPASELPLPVTLTAPSLGASMLSLVSDLSDEMRRSNREARSAQTQAVVESIHQQADEIRDQAVTNLAMGLTSSIISIGASVASFAMSASGLKSSGGLGAQLTSEQGIALQAHNLKTQAFTSGMQGLADAVEKTRGFISATHDAAIKDLDAQVELFRAHRDQIDSLDQALKEVIAKARDAQNEIQQNMNQTRTKILS